MRHRPTRRALLCALPACAAVVCFGTSWAADPSPDSAVARIRTFYATLLETMKQAKRMRVQARYDKLAPAVRATFDLAAMTRMAVGPSWTTFTPADKEALVDAFSRMTIATYANRFDGYSGEKFEVDGTPEARGKNAVVKTQLIKSDGQPVTLNYLMHPAGADWQITDVYLSGTISELATRRSEFGATLKSGGAKALIDSLKQRADKLLS